VEANATVSAIAKVAEDQLVDYPLRIWAGLSLYRALGIDRKHQQYPARVVFS